MLSAETRPKSVVNYRCDFKMVGVTPSICIQSWRPAKWSPMQICLLQRPKGGCDCLICIIFLPFIDVFLCTFSPFFKQWNRLSDLMSIYENLTLDVALIFENVRKLVLATSSPYIASRIKFSPMLYRHIGVPFETIFDILFRHLNQICVHTPISGRW